jgi:hypothetical protein
MVGAFCAAWKLMDSETLHEGSRRGLCPRQMENVLTTTVIIGQEGGQSPSSRRA